MTDNDWTTQLRDRLAEHEMPAPDGLWDDIEAKLTAFVPLGDACELNHLEIENKSSETRDLTI